MIKQGNIYFASDFHLGAGDIEDTRRREAVIVSWMESITSEARAIYLVGDVFDFWFEYKWTVPKGYVRLLGALAKLVDAGVEVHFLRGNHDMWVYRYFQEEIGMIVHDGSVTFMDQGKSFFIDHGDGLGDGEKGYKMIRSALRNKFLQRSYARLHPSWGLRLMRKMSAKSRSRHEAISEGEEVHDLPIRFAEAYIMKHPTDYFIMGHRHHAIDKVLSNGTSHYINLGDWVTKNTYAVWDGSEVSLKIYDD